MIPAWLCKYREGEHPVPVASGYMLTCSIPFTAVYSLKFSADLPLVMIQ